jgi:hypothetical protein
MGLGLAAIDITANLAPLRKGIARANGLIKGMVKRAGSVMKSGFALAFRAIKSGLRTITRLAKITAAALLGIGIASVKIASDVVETDNLFRISMGSMADEAAAFAFEYSKSLGLFENDTRKALGTFQLMLTSMGLGEEAAFDMSKGLTQLVNDISSFRNQRPEEVFLKLQAGITGESEPLKRLGILVNETTIKQLALTDATVQARIASEKSASSGNKRIVSLKKQIESLSKMGKTAQSIKLDRLKKQLKATTDASKKQTIVLTENEKVMLRYKAIVNATRLDMGDMARTMDDTANVFRVIWAQVKITANTIGKVLLPEVTKAGIAVREFFINNQPMIKQWAEVALAAIQKVVKWLKITFDLASQGRFGEIFDEIGRLFAVLLGQLGTLLGRFVPVIAKIGVMAGKAFAEGFMQEVEGTPLGKILKGVGKAIDIATAFPKAQGRLAGAVARPFITSGAAQLSPSAQSQLDTIPAQQLQELRRINQRFAEQERDF